MPAGVGSPATACAQNEPRAVRNRARESTRREARSAVHICQPDARMKRRKPEGDCKERAEMLQSPVGVVFKDLYAEMGEH